MLALDTFARLLRPAAGIEVCAVNVASRKRFAKAADKSSAESLLSYCREHYPGWIFDGSDIDVADAGEAVARLQSERAFDLIVVPNRRKSMFSRVFSPGLANKMLFQADLPMLVIPV